MDAESYNIMPVQCTLSMKFINILEIENSFFYDFFDIIIKSKDPYKFDNIPMYVTGMSLR